MVGQVRLVRGVFASVLVMVLFAAGLVAASGVATPVADAGGQKMLMVVGAVNASNLPPKADRPVLALFESLGFEVSLVNDDDASAADADGQEIVVVSSSVVPTTIGDMFAAVAVPVVTWEGYLFDDFGFTSGSHGGTSTTQTQLDIVDPDHPISAGYNATTTVTTTAHRFAFADPADSAQVVARTGGRDVIFAFENQALLADATPAPARRVALFMNYQAAGVLTQAGLDIVAAAAGWATETTGVPGNTAPVVDAGGDRTVTSAGPVTIVLDADVRDDGRPVPGSISTFWTCACVIDFGPNVVDIEVTLPGPGTYLLTLSAFDGDLGASDTMTITVLEPSNEAPDVNAGTDTSIALPTNTVNLDGTVTDDGVPLPSTLTTTWTQLSGPSGVTFDDHTAIDTTATFPGAGQYVLTLTGSDGERSTSDNITINVDAVLPAGTINIAYIASKEPLPSGDRPIRDRLIANGATITIIDDDALRSDYSGFDAIFLSTSVVYDKIGDHFANTAVPLISTEHYLYDDMNMASARIGTQTSNTIRIDTPGHELAASNTGQLQITNTATGLGYGTPGPDATTIATVNNRAVYFAYKTGDTMANNTPAPARRVAFPATFTTPRQATPEWFNLLDAALAYALTPDNNPPEANPDRASTDENTPITIGPDYTTSISSAGGDIEKIAIDPRTGNYVVLDVVSSLVRVRVYDPDNRRVLHTTSLASPGPAAAIPGGVDVDLRTGNVVVAESRNSTITVLDPTLSTVLDSETVTGLGMVRAVTVDPFTGNIIVGGQDVSRIYTPGFASFTDVDHNGLIATGFDVDERNGDIVAVLYEDQGSFGPGQVQRWDDEGDFLSTIATSNMDFPWDLSIEQLTGDTAVANRSTLFSDVTVFDENGLVESVISRFDGPQGVAFDPMTGHLAVADDGGSLVNRASGALLDSFLDPRGPTMAVQPVSEEILANSSVHSDRRLVTLDPTTRTRLGLDERFVVDVATDPTTGRIAVIVGEASSSRVLEIYDPTGSTLLHSTSVPGASVAFHPDTGEVGVTLRTGEFRLYDPTLTTVLTTFPFASTDMIGIQPGTGNVVTRFTLTEVRIFDDGGTQVGSIGPFTSVSDLAVDPATGNIAVASTNVEIWDPTGTTMLGSIPVPSAGDSAVGVAYGGTGNLIVGYDNHGSLDVLARGLLANDTDPDGDPLTVTGFDSTSANGASVTVDPDGSFTYDPTGVPAIEALTAGQTLADTFTYTIDDGNGETDTATVTIVVAGVNDAPVLGGPIAVAVNENVSAVADYDATDDTNSEGSGLTYSLIGAIDDDLFSIDSATGALAFLVAPDFENPTDEDENNAYEVVVRVNDSDGSGAAVAVSVAVLDVTETDLPPMLVSSTPAEGATIDPDADIQLTFSEPVTLIQDVDPAILIACDRGGSVAPPIVTGGPTVFTVSPASDLPAGANCTFGLQPSRIVDQDGTPDPLPGEVNLDFQVTPP